MKFCLFLIFCCIGLVAAGQSVADTISRRTEDLKVKAKPEIPMILPKMVPTNLPMTMGYRLCDLQFSQPFPACSGFEPNKMKLNLSFDPRKANKLLYGATRFAGMMNNQIVGEDKMMIARMNQAINSRSGIPESAIPANDFIAKYNK